MGKVRQSSRATPVTIHRGRLKDSVPAGPARSWALHQKAVTVPRPALLPHIPCVGWLSEAAVASWDVTAGRVCELGGAPGQPLPV